MDHANHAVKLELRVKDSISLTGRNQNPGQLAVVRRELGRAGLARFLQHFQNGKGDYTRERGEVLKDLTMDGLRAHVRARQKRRGTIVKPQNPSSESVSDALDFPF